MEASSEPSHPSGSNSAGITAAATVAPTPDTAETHSSSIQVTTRSDLSVLYKILRVIIRPLRPRLVKLGDPAPPGSQKLSPPRRRGCEVIESRRCGVWEYTFRHPKGSRSRPQEEAATNTKTNTNTTTTNAEANATVTGRNRKSAKHRIYYFNGGGFQSPPSSEHWRFIAHFTEDLAVGGDRGGGAREIQVTLVSHPLAPASPAADALPVLREWFASALDDADGAGDTVTLMGDSSGGNLALTLAFAAVESYKPSKSDSGKALPLVSVFVISPAVDLRNVNPEIWEADKHDPILTIGTTSEVARAWTGNIDQEALRETPGDPPRATIATSDPAVSPLLHTDDMFRLLRDRGVSVHGVVGTHDVLAPDALEFMRKCERLGMRGKWLVWDGQMHCFPMAGGGKVLGLREGQEGRKWVDEVLREDANRSEGKSLSMDVR